MSARRRGRRAPAAGLLAWGSLVLLCGCSLEDERPTEIRPPVTPTDVREAHRVSSALATYRRDGRLIRSTRRSCSRGLPASFYRRVCGPELRPLVAQQRTHLREALGGLPPRVGPFCRQGLRSVLAAPVSRAGKPLRAAVSSCRGEYRRALRG